ncbi:hypothetical protein [Bradyrhizobium sp. MOS002]|uniref:hypothetical protein n=1 Tax=Bradyrhizobium sp. MOS002 TaxID=2133947 RepID=UPI0011B2235B|nr:hypothetical protein [Bradyrhizobium sp. MOS002]
MRSAKHDSTTKLSNLFRDPYLRDVFARAEDDGLAPDLAETDNPPMLSGGAAEVVPTAGHRVRMLVEA